MRKYLLGTLSKQLLRLSETSIVHVEYFEAIA